MSIGLSQKNSKLRGWEYISGVEIILSNQKRPNIFTTAEKPEKEKKVKVELLYFDMLFINRFYI